MIDIRDGLGHGVVKTVMPSEMPDNSSAWINFDVSQFGITGTGIEVEVYSNSSGWGWHYGWLTPDLYPRGSLYEWYTYYPHWERMYVAWDYCDACFKTYTATPTGACCNDITCTQTTPENCTGVFKGLGIRCEDDPCMEDAGACCDGEICNYHTLPYCTTGIGTWKGVGSSCIPNPCLPNLSWYSFSCNPADNPRILSDECCTCTDYPHWMYFTPSDIYHAPVDIYGINITSLSQYTSGTRGDMIMSVQSTSWSNVLRYEVDTSPYNPEPYTYTHYFDPPLTAGYVAFKLGVEDWYNDYLDWSQCYGNILMRKHQEYIPKGTINAHVEYTYTPEEIPWLLILGAAGLGLGTGYMLKRRKK